MKGIEYSDGDILITHRQEETPKSAFWGGKICLEYELYFFERGSADVLLEGHKYRLGQGNLALFLPGQYMEIHIDCSAPCEYYTIKFSDAVLPTELFFDIKKASGCYAAKPNREFLFQKLDYHITNYTGEHTRGLLRCGFFEILYYLCNESMRLEPAAENKAVSDVIRYVERNIQQNFSLYDICENLKYPEPYICKVFSKYIKTTLMKYVKIKRILLSESYIARGAKPNDIFKKCGFADYSTFYRSYKSILGRTPSGHTD